MSSTPIFDQLLAEYGKEKQRHILETMEKPFMVTVKTPLPKRSVAQFIADPVVEDDLYISPKWPLPSRAETIQRRLRVYHQGLRAGRQKADEGFERRFAEPMSERTIPLWIGKEIQESNEALSDPEPVDEAISITVTGTTPEQTDESVSAASNHADSTSVVKPLWDINEE